MAKKNNIPKAHRKPPKPKAVKKRKKSRFVDLEQIRRWFITNHYDVETPESFVVSEVFSCYKHPKGKHKPLATSIKQAIRREWKRWETHPQYVSPTPTDNPNLFHMNYPNGKDVYDNHMKKTNPNNALGNVDALARKIQRDLTKTEQQIQRLKKELLEAQNKQLRLQQKQCILNNFLQHDMTVEVISLVEKDLQ
tara:strand:- start:4253 stop:4834 length:582 start_codon:yes stop_codon:yes gene_type:complete